MANGMTFNDVTSQSLGLEYCVPRIPLLPDRRPSVVDIIGRDGTVDFQNDSYAPRQIPVDCLIESTSETNLAASLAKVAAWLSGSGYLVFDHDTTKRWSAKVYQMVEQERYPNVSRFTVLFDAQPYAEDVDETIGTIGTEQDYGSDVIFYPVIEVTLTGAASSVQVSLTSTGEYVLVENDALAENDVLAFDMEKGLVTLNDSSCMSDVNISSLFFGVPPGLQTITVTTDGTYTATIAYRKRYLYA